MTTAPFEFVRFLVTAAREFSEDDVCFVGFHWPMVAARIARRLHAPSLTVVYEAGVVEDTLTPELSTSPSDHRSAVDSPMCSGSLDALYAWLNRGRVTRTFLEAANVDRRGNVNTTVIGDYADPTVRMPGSGGGTELGSFGRGLTLLSPSTAPRNFPEAVDYITSPGYLDRPGRRAENGYPPRGPEKLLTPLGEFSFDDESGLTVRSLHHGVTGDDVRACFRWIDSVEPTADPIAPPTAREIEAVHHVLDEAAAMRYLMPRGVRS